MKYLVWLSLGWVSYCYLEESVIFVMLYDSVIDEFVESVWLDRGILCVVYVVLLLLVGNGYFWVD